MGWELAAECSKLSTWAVSFPGSIAQSCRIQCLLLSFLEITGSPDSTH